MNEIPKSENGKFEIDKSTELNPIKQDVKKNAPRFIANNYPYYGYPWNYGALPQTWEDPTIEDKFCNEKGDNDPLDII